MWFFQKHGPAPVRPFFVRQHFADAFHRARLEISNSGEKSLAIRSICEYIRQICGDTMKIRALIRCVDITTEFGLCDREQPMNTLAKWGISLAVRIPAKFAEQSGMREGTPVNINVKGGRLIIERARPKFKLRDLLAGYSPDDQPEDLWKAPAVGDEEW